MLSDTLDRGSTKHSLAPGDPFLPLRFWNAGTHAARSCCRFNPRRTYTFCPRFYPWAETTSTSRAPDSLRAGRTRVPSTAAAALPQPRRTHAWCRTEAEHREHSSLLPPGNGYKAPFHYHGCTQPGREPARLFRPVPVADLKETDLKEIITGCRNPRPHIETHLPARDATPGRSSPPLVAAASRRSPPRGTQPRTPPRRAHSNSHRLTAQPAPPSPSRRMQRGTLGSARSSRAGGTRAPPPQAGPAPPRGEGARRGPPRGAGPPPSARPVPPYPHPNPGGPSRGARASASAGSGRPPARPARTPPGTRRPGPSGAAPRRALDSLPAPGPGLPDGAGGSAGPGRSRLGLTAVTQPAEAGGEEGAAVLVSLPPPSRLGRRWAPGPQPSVGLWRSADAVRNPQMAKWDGVGWRGELGTASCAWGSVVPELHYSQSCSSCALLRGLDCMNTGFVVFVCGKSDLVVLRF